MAALRIMPIGDEIERLKSPDIRHAVAGFE